MKDIWIKTPTNMEDLAYGIVAMNHSDEILKFVLHLDSLLMDLDFAKDLRSELDRRIAMEEQ